MKALVFIIVAGMAMFWICAGILLTLCGLGFCGFIMFGGAAVNIWYCSLLLSGDPSWNKIWKD